MKKRKWESWEDKFVREQIMEDKKIAEYLNRSVSAICTRRCRIKSRIKIKDKGISFKRGVRLLYSFGLETAVNCYGDESEYFWDVATGERFMENPYEYVVYVIVGKFTWNGGYSQSEIPFWELHKRYNELLKKFDVRESIRRLLREFNFEPLYKADDFRNWNKHPNRYAVSR